MQTAMDTTELYLGNDRTLTVRGFRLPYAVAEAERFARFDRDHAVQSALRSADRASSDYSKTRDAVGAAWMDYASKVTAAVIRSGALVGALPTFSGRFADGGPATLEFDEYRGEYRAVR